MEDPKKTAALANCPLRLPAGGMDLAATLQCGQTFSWQAQEAGGFAGVAGGRAVRAWQQGDVLLLQRLDGEAATAEDEAFWRDYFALEQDWPALQACFSRHEHLGACVACAPGLRLLRQPFFETLLAFIISQNNHIPRIAGIVERLRTQFGTPLAAGQYAFPTAQALAGRAVEDLAGLRAGFRTKYLLDAAAKVANGTVDEAALRAAPTAEAREMLQAVQGVGPKVADCVLLYALDRWEVAPMDVWMRRAMQARFPAGMPACAEGREGVAQLYIFAWARDNLPRGGKAGGGGA